MNMPSPPSGPWSDPADWPAEEGVADEQPKSIRLAVRLMYVGAAFSLINILASFLQTDEIRDGIRDAASDPMTESELDSAVTAVLTIAGIVGVIAIGLWIWMATTNGQGKAWARTTATVLGGLNVLFTLIGFVGGQLTPLAVGVSLISIGLAVSIIVLLFRPDASRYYDAKSAQLAR